MTHCYCHYTCACSQLLRRCKAALLRRLMRLSLWAVAAGNVWHSSQQQLAQCHSGRSWQVGSVHTAHLNAFRGGRHVLVGVQLDRPPKGVELTSASPALLQGLQHAQRAVGGNNGFSAANGQRRGAACRSGRRRGPPGASPHSAALDWCGQWRTVCACAKPCKHA
jgi:hypothetical protein